jgi:hypothetical protein
MFVLIHNLNELFDYILRRTRAVWKLQIKHLDVRSFELPSVVEGLIESYHCFDPDLFEQAYHFFGGLGRVLLADCLGRGRAGQDAARHDPGAVQVAELLKSIVSDPSVLDA